MPNKQDLPRGISKDEFGEITADKSFKGLFIQKSSYDEISLTSDYLYIEGVYGIFVNSGGAMEMWQQFPESVIFTAKDLEALKIYETHFDELSISWEGEPDFGPSNQIVQKSLTVDLFNSLPTLKENLDRGSQLEIYGTFKGVKSNTIIIEF